jgi:ferredoxin-nitrate reductase
VNLEQDGTFCNSERRVTLMEKVVDPPAEAKPDWWWIREIALAMELGDAVKFESAASIFDEFARSTAGRPNDQSGMYHAQLKSQGPQQWPMPAMGGSSPRRYLDHVFPTPSGKARFWARAHEIIQEKVTSEFPLILTTGRELNQWHTRTKTGLVEQLNNQSSSPSVQIHPDDAQQLSLRDGQRVEVISRRGRAVSVVKIDPAISPGVVYMPIHWNDLFAPLTSPNEAASDQTDPISKQPALKCCAVAVHALQTQPEPRSNSATFDGSLRLVQT